MDTQKLNLLTRVIEDAIAQVFTNVEVETRSSVVSTRNYIGVTIGEETFIVQIDAT